MIKAILAILFAALLVGCSTIEPMTSGYELDVTPGETGRHWR